MKKCIYRFKDECNNIIYIGKALDLKQRLYNHHHLSDNCYEEVYNIEYIEFETKDEMDLAERYFIPKYKPKYNTVFKERILTFKIKEFDERKWISVDDKKSKIATLNEEKQKIIECANPDMSVEDILELIGIVDNLNAEIKAIETNKVS